ncbi:WAT1-related protein At3g30340-like isoform X2 [Momordica charantia]|uniref:WAT1-related protein n=1 Tax=Momordica charantia TaxID=3673 RepID=A0A6J1DPU7_MOMCH|nr:WAT1-related protein At3g30340-like isoform X2 [Momordica charantia]
MMMKGVEDLKPLIAMVAVDLGFAIVNILLETVLDHGMNHLVLITYRLAIAAISLAPIAYFYERASLTQYCFLLGIQHTSATFACAFINIVPVATFLLALPFGLETLNLKCSSGKAKMVGTVVCISGAVLLTAYKGPALANGSYAEKKVAAAAAAHGGAKKPRAESWTVGCIALVAGTLLWSSWFPLQSNIGKRYPYQYWSTAIMSFFGAAQSAVLSLATGATLSSWALDGNIKILTVVYSGMIGSGLCVVGMSWCVKKRGPVFTAAFSPLVQIMAGMFDIPILHDPLYLGNLLGSVIVIVGLYILLWGKNKEMKNCASKVVVMEGIVTATAQDQQDHQTKELQEMKELQDHP